MKKEFKNIQILKKEIKYWNDIEKQIDDCPKDNYKEFTRLEKLWMNCPIDILKAKLQTLQEVCKEIKKVILNIGAEQSDKHLQGMEIFEEEILSKLKGKK